MQYSAKANSAYCWILHREKSFVSLWICTSFNIYSLYSCLGFKHDFRFCLNWRKLLLPTNFTTVLSSSTSMDIIFDTLVNLKMLESKFCSYAFSKPVISGGIIINQFMNKHILIHMFWAYTNKRIKLCFPHQTFWIIKMI